MADAFNAPRIKVGLDFFIMTRWLHWAGYQPKLGTEIGSMWLRIGNWEQFSVGFGVKGGIMREFSGFMLLYVSFYKTTQCLNNIVELLETSRV